MTVFPAGRPVVDREQVRKDAEAVMPLPPGTNQGKLARHCLALLAELEQAEARLAACGRELERAGVVLSRLGMDRVPALVEALTTIADPCHHHYKPDYVRPEVLARDALAEWERA